jgi:hypothetical protein
MHVHTLTAENFKRLHAVTIAFPPGGGTMEVCGKNGMGKSSAIDALFSAIAGKDASPEQPIRSGARAGRVEIDLGEYKVTREWDGKGTRLKVEAAGGAKVGSPQALLDGLFARLAFDPLEFTRQGPRAQAETLRRVTGLDFADLDRRRAEVYAERTDVNRAVKRQEMRAAELPEVPEVAEVSAAELNDRLQLASRNNVEVARAKRAQATAEDDMVAAGDEVLRLDAALREARARQADAARRAVELWEAIGEEVDTSPILDEIAAIEQTNRRARQYRERAAALDELRANRAHAERLGDEIAAIDRERAEMLRTAAWPVEGLALDGDAVTYRGVPFAQASASEQIRVGLAMAAALNPTLRLAAIREGSLLDEAALREVAAWAGANDYQVIVERVADSAVGPGVVIEEGRVKAAAGPESPRLFA